jgi:hypothetical protein
MSNKVTPKRYKIVEVCQGCGKENCDSCPCGTYFVKREIKEQGNG